MAINVAELRIIKYPADVLKQKAQPLESITDEVRSVAQRMIELMHEAEGIGLAAPQVGLSWRLFVADVPPTDERSPDENPPTAMDGARVYINPRLSEFSRDLVGFEEGCLSIPGIVGEVRRPSEVTITALDVRGEPFSERGGQLLARCWQHEYDHLDGVLTLDRMTPRSRLKNRSAVRELEQGARIA